MTKINKLVLQGFKSFAKRTEFIFGEKFNCILGPNGSGKSNVLDALCFVLGKSSIKSLRAEKASNLIYNGGKRKNPASFAEVSIYFDNSKKEFPTEEEEIKITRIVKQNGLSKYKINDKTRTRQQVLELLNYAKINPDGYNIILQGDIVTFTEMPSIQRRQLIEDIAGIGVYEEKKQKAMNELEKVEQKLKEAEIILSERKTYLKELKRDRDQALKYKEMMDKINQNKASYLKIQIDKKEEEKKDIDNKINEVNKLLEKINNSIKKLEEEAKSKKEQINKLTENIEKRGEKEQIELTETIEDLRVELAKLNSRKDVCKGEIEKIKSRKKDLENSIKDNQENIKKLEEDIKKIREEKESAEKEKERIEQIINDFKEKNKIDNLENLNKEIEEIEKTLEEKQKEVFGLREKQHSLLREKDKLELEINSFNERIKKVLEIEKQHKEELEKINQKKQEFKKKVEELNKALEEGSYLTKNINLAKEKLSKKEEELSKLKAKQLLLSSSIKEDLSTKKILSLKKKGVYGRVRDLLEVEEKFSLAIETALGQRIKSLVVEDDKTAAECIKYLKENKLGVATFLPLNKIKAKETREELKELLKKEGCFGAAIDFIKFDKKFKNIFKYLLANTVIVKDIDTARKIGIGKARIVTLEGDIAELSGVMIGGFRKRKSIFKEKQLYKNISDTKKEIEELKNKLNTFIKRNSENEKKIEELRKQKAALEGEIIKMESSLHLEKGDLEITKTKKQELVVSLKKIEEEIKNIEGKIEKINTTFIKEKERKEELRSKLNKMSNPEIVAELNAFEEQRNKINEKITQLSFNIKNIKTQIENIYTPEIEKTKKIISQHNKEKEDFEEEIEEIDKKIKQKEKDLRDYEKKEAEFKVKFKNFFEKRDKLTEEIHKIEIEVSKKQGKAREFEIRKNNYTIKKAEITAQLTALNEEFTQYHGIKIITNKTEDELKKEIGKFERMKDEIGNVNMRALEIYDEVEKEYNKLLGKKANLEKEKKDVLKMMNEIESKKKAVFMETLNKVNENFVKMFKNLAKKGEAYLELENKENPFEGGLRIKVKITTNKFLDIRSLSGGEKTLTALAFIFTIQEYEPASFYILDEVDAALDKHNSEKFAKLIRAYAEKAQYIIISHNDAVISEADNLYGITMDEDGISKCVSLKI